MEWPREMHIRLTRRSRHDERSVCAFVDQHIQGETKERHEHAFDEARPAP
jgi:hypothetical protein